jgi:hypothetical protein
MIASLAKFRRGPDASSGLCKKGIALPQTRLHHRHLRQVSRVRAEHRRLLALPRSLLPRRQHLSDD